MFQHMPHQMPVPDINMPQRPQYPPMIQMNKQANMPGGMFPYYHNHPNQSFMPQVQPSFSFGQPNPTPNLHSQQFIRSTFQPNHGYPPGNYNQPVVQPNLNMPQLEIPNQRV